MRPYLDNSAILSSFYQGIVSVGLGWRKAVFVLIVYAAIWRKVVGKMCTRIAIPKGSMGYDQYTVPDTVVVEPAFVAFL